MSDQDQTPQDAQPEPDNRVDDRPVPEYVQRRVQMLMGNDTAPEAGGNIPASQDEPVAPGADAAPEDDPELEARVNEIRERIAKAEKLERELAEMREQFKKREERERELEQKLLEYERKKALEISDEEKALIGGEEGLNALSKVVERIVEARLATIKNDVEQKLSQTSVVAKTQAVEELEKRRAAEARAERERTFNSKIFSAIPEWNKIAGSKQLKEYLQKDFRAAAVVKEIFASKNSSDEAIGVLKDVVAAAMQQNAPQQKYQSSPSFSTGQLVKDSEVDLVARARALARSGEARKADVSGFLNSIYGR